MGVALAQAAPGGNGRAHLARGLERYRAGAYAAAIAEFEAGYAQAPRPAFLFNIAQAWRKLGRLDTARTFYVRYVSEAPSRDPARTPVLEAIAKIDAQLAREEAQRAATAGHAAAAAAAPQAAEPHAPAATDPGDATAAAPAPAPASTSARTAPPAPSAPVAAAVRTTPVPAASPKGRSRRVAGFLGVGLAALGLASLGAATGYALAARDLDAQYAHPTPGMVYDPQLVDRRDFDHNLSIGLFAGGGALVLAGTVLAAALLPRALSRRAARALVEGHGLAVHF